jgi:hypothetical protein
MEEGPGDRMREAREDAEAGRPRPGSAAVLFLVVIWALFTARYAGVTRDERQIYFGGDQADLLRGADETLRGHPPLVGARSREGLFHPGPLFVYVVAAVQTLTSGREAMTISTLSLLQATSLLFLSLLALRLSGSVALAASLPYVVVFNYTFLIYLRFLWNVTIVAPALALAVWLIVTVEPPRPWKLPALAAVLSLVAQAHMGFVPVAVWLGFVALARSFMPPRLDRWRSLLPAAGVLALIWFPVLWVGIWHHGGNLARIAARFGGPHEPHSFREVLRAIDSLLSELIRGGPAARFGILAASIALLAIAGFRGGDWARQLRLLFAAVGGAWIIFFLSVRAIPEPIQTYYLRPIWVIAAATFIGGASALVSLLRDERTRSAVGLGIGAVIVAALVRPALEMRSVFARPDWNSIPLAEIRTVAAGIAARVGQGEPRTADVSFELGNLDGAAPSFLYLLHRQGVEYGRVAGAHRFRVAEASENPPEGVWVQVLRTEKFRLEVPKEDL